MTTDMQVSVYSVIGNTIHFHKYHYAVQQISIIVP